MSAEMLTKAEGDFAYQVVGEEYVWSHDSAALFWGYSTGKTRVVLTRLVRDPRIETCFYFTRKNNVGRTSAELRKHFTGEVVECIGSTQRVLNIIRRTSSNLRTQRTTCVFTMNYDKARTMYKELAEFGVHAIVIDECTAIKHWSKRSKCLYALGNLPSVVFRCIMTGEPAPQRKEDYYYQFYFLHGNANPLGMTKWAFQNRYFTKMGWDLILKPGARQRLLKVVAENSSIVETSDVRIPLRKRRDIITVPRTKEQKKWLEMLSEGVVLFEDRTAWMPTNPAVAFEKRLQICSGYFKMPEEHGGGILKLSKSPKLEALCEYIDLEMSDHRKEGGPKIVLVARRNQELDDLINMAKSMKIEHVVYRGQQTARQNDIAASRMLEDPSVRIMIAQADMLAGLNECITADTMIWYSNSPVVESRMQAEMRLDRPGQKYRIMNFIDFAVEDEDDEAQAFAIGTAKMDCRGFTNKAKLLQAAKAKLASRDNP